MPTSSYWERVNRRDRRVVRLADRHYSREVIGSPQVGGSGFLVVLTTPCGDAAWITRRQPNPTHRWKASWDCVLFRNESPVLSSVLIRDAVAVTRALWGDPPSDGFLTYVDPTATRRKRDPGRCYRKAGWRLLPDRSTRGLVVLQLLPADFPPPVLPLGSFDFSPAALAV